MTQKIFLFFIAATLLFSCSSDKDVKLEDKKITLNFHHYWNDTPVSKADFNNIKFTNENGEQVSIERYRYLLSQINLIDQNNNQTALSDYLLINLGEEKNLSFTTTKLILDGNYELQFNFGFNDGDNQKNYADLNSETFNVPDMLGGGYHYMQFDGKFTSTTTKTPAAFNYHAIKAVDVKNPSQPTAREPKDTSFAVNLNNIEIGSDNEIIIDVKVNIAEWFKNPTTWDLNLLNVVLMPDYDAQILMSKNGKTVFSLKNDI